MTTTMISPNDAIGPTKGPIKLVSVAMGRLGANISTSRGSLDDGPPTGAVGFCSTLLSSRPTLSTS